MVNHRAQAQFERARWQSIILFPVWTLQLLITVSTMGFFAWRLGDTMKHYDERDTNGQAPTIEIAWEATNVVLSFVAAMCTLIEIVKYMAEALTPWTMLFTHIIKLACASAICALDAVVYAQLEKYHSLIGLGLDVALLVTAVGLAIYAIVTYRRLSQYDDYVRPVNVKGYGFSDNDHRDFSYSSRLSIRNSMDKRGSIGSHRLSIGSAHNEPVGLQNLQRTPSYYSHERDTQFDEYVARRNSMNNNRPDLERATSGEYKRDSLSGGSPPLDSLVVMGMVQSRPRGSSISRAVSYTSDHVLVAVPEEETEAYDAGTKRHGDKTALLGNNRQNSGEHTMEAVPATEWDITDPRWRRE
ncbi:hypothetical protein QQS21_002354 [Conoideocrella luteorostrata]|uniref:Uncharacterized protein n=1 Tax=Conoideocrella luteorostrata TaxID=1105319 RepID=A0AAJ0CVC3_9HYPO|nr:hypothetical protein QQS21_002354 [Conoideocrella luteorostrata]